MKTTKTLIFVSIFILIQPLLWSNGNNDYYDYNQGYSDGYGYGGYPDADDFGYGQGYPDGDGYSQGFPDGDDFYNNNFSNCPNGNCKGWGNNNNNNNNNNFGGNNPNNLGRIFWDTSQNRSITAADLSAKDKMELQKIHSTLLVLNQAGLQLQAILPGTGYNQQGMGQFALNLHSNALRYFALTVPSNTSTSSSGSSKADLLKKLASSSASGIQDIENWNSAGLHNGLIRYVARTERMLLFVLRRTVYELTLDGQPVTESWRALLGNTTLLARQWAGGF